MSFKLMLMHKLHFCGNFGENDLTFSMSNIMIKNEFNAETIS